MGAEKAGVWGVRVEDGSVERKCTLFPLFGEFYGVEVIESPLTQLVKACGLFSVESTGSLSVKNHT